MARREGYRVGGEDVVLGRQFSTSAAGTARTKGGRGVVSAPRTEAEQKALVAQGKAAERDRATRANAKKAKTNQSNKVQKAKQAYRVSRQRGETHSQAMMAAQAHNPKFSQQDAINIGGG